MPLQVSEIGGDVIGSACHAPRFRFQCIGRELLRVLRQVERTPVGDDCQWHRAERSPIVGLAPAGAASKRSRKLVANTCTASCSAAFHRRRRRSTER